MEKHIYKSHNKTLLLYHLVFPAKYRRKVFDESVDKTLKRICLEISDRYEIHFVEIGNDLDHVHFLVQSVPMLSITKIVGQFSNSEVIKQYIKNQGKDSEYKKLHQGQLNLEL